MSEVVASGTVRVHSLDTGEEWDEMVEVFEEDLVRESRDSGTNSSDDESDTLTDTDGSALTVEDAARRQARRQAGPGAFETFEADLS